MKVIDILNKIANGEEVPKKIIYRDTEYDFNLSVGDYIPDIGEQLFTKLFSTERTKIFINDEVEIIGEDKKIEKLDLGGYNYCGRTDNWYEGEHILVDKINEIIDKLNEEKEND